MSEKSPTTEIQRLIARAARRGVVADPASAAQLASLGALAAARKLDGACRLIRAAREEDRSVSFREALRRIDACAGDVEEAIRRTLDGGLEVREGVPEMLDYAAERAIAFTPGTICGHFAKRGRGGTRDYIDDLSKIMDAAAKLGIDCTQPSATRLLARAGNDPERVIADFVAKQSRRASRGTGACLVRVPPRDPRASANARARCACPRCRECLAAELQSYISKLLRLSFFAYIDREEARGEANAVLVEAIHAWPGGPNFRGWFATRFIREVRRMYTARRRRREEAMLPFDAARPTDDEGRSAVALNERIRDPSSIDPLTFVLLRERLSERARSHPDRRAA